MYILSYLNIGQVTCFESKRSGSFSAPEPEGSSALLWSRVVRRPSSVRRPSLTFHIFDFSSETTEQNSTNLDGKQELTIL